MKQLSVVIAFLLLILGKAQAQDRKLGIGMELGPGLISLRANDLLEREPTLGGSGGLYFRYNFKKYLSLQTGLSIEREGSKSRNLTFMDMDGTEYPMDLYYHYDYLSMPLLLRGGIGKTVKYYATVGIYFAYLVQANAILKVDQLGTYEIDQYDRLRPIASGMIMGLGISVPLQSRWALSFEVRNCLGGSDITSVHILHHEPTRTHALRGLFGLTYAFGSSY